jgi:hypothetical protein
VSVQADAGHHTPCWPSEDYSTTNHKASHHDLTAQRCDFRGKRLS